MRVSLQIYYFICFGHCTILETDRSMFSDQQCKVKLHGLVGGIINGDPAVFFKAGVETSVMIRVRGGDSQENLTIRVEVRHQAPSFSTLNMFRRWEKNSMF